MNEIQTLNIEVTEHAIKCTTNEAQKMIKSIEKDCDQKDVISFDKNIAFD